jgi:hypothetical protein
MASNSTEDNTNDKPSTKTDTDATLPAEKGDNEPADTVVAAADEEVLVKDAKSKDEMNGFEKNADQTEDGEVDETPPKDGGAEAPPLPDGSIPPLPSELPPAAIEQDDGWAPIWEESAQAFYFYNRLTGATQWTNPRVPEPSAPGVEAPQPPAARPAGGYDPAIHGDYDPNAWYAQPSELEVPPQTTGPQDPAAAYAATAAFNRFTGRFQNADLAPENFNDENKSKRQMNAFFDVDAAANSHDGRSLKEERSGKKLTKAELKKFKEKRKAKKEEKRKAWLRD